MSFDHDGFLDPDEVLRLDELALTNLNTGMDLGLVVESGGAPVEGESTRAYHDGKPHLNLLGWASMALIGFYVLHFGDRLNARLERIQFWLHQVGAVILLITLTLVMLGNTAIEPVLGITSIVVGVSVLLFAVNVWRSLR